MRKSVWRELALITVVACITSYAWTFSRVSVPNERTRLYLTMAIVDHGTVAIDEPLRQYGSVYDLASYRNRYYTDKAPGSSLLAVPLYAMVRTWSEPNAWSIVELTNLVRTFLMLPFGLLGFVLLRALLRRMSLSDAAIDITSLGFSLGSPVLHYSGAFYGHVLVAVLVLASLYCASRAGLLRSRGTAAAEVSAGKMLALVAGAGACSGLAGLIEYQAIVLAAVLGIPVLFAPPRRILPGVLAYTFGAAPFAAALLAYNAHAFGGPFELSYQHLVASSLQELHGFGLAGATWPTREVLNEMAVSHHRGLFITTPFLAFGLFALPFSFRRLGFALWTTALLGAVYFVLIVAASSVWYGGWSFGLRLLIPVYGLLAIGAAVGFDTTARWLSLEIPIRAAAIFSVLYHLALHATMTELPPEFMRPLPDAVEPMLFASLIAPNLACKVVGLSLWNLAPLAAFGLVAVGWIAWCGGSRLRLPRAAASLLLAGLAFARLSTAAPSIPPEEQARWVRMVQRWTDAESRCRRPDAPKQ